MTAPGKPEALPQLRLCSGTDDVIQPDGACADWECVREDLSRPLEPQLPANHLCVPALPEVVTYRAPAAVMEHLHTCYVLFALLLLLFTSKRPSYSFLPSLKRAIIFSCSLGTVEQLSIVTNNNNNNNNNNNKLT